ncbi:hypothetical protein QL992_07410 [Microbacterium sp. APC 3898]|uniref:DUF7878 domain-containing protein n=2 Tax=Planococcus TaxID=1372 RepID=A0ABT7ZLC4_9BACL|nr:MULTISPECIES: hypothetical protein [Terrabacteria group]MBD8014591.1 hypothetical protein [Planococcus wigleyi]MDN3427482.1 hypothetical protein [Planococcus sp. APC 4016]MDN3499033.1 hypothetical protein [Microbacterium sp. APC 3898]
MENLAIDFELDPLLKLDKKLIRQKNGKLLIDVQGELTIHIGHSCFFHEQSLALLELGIALKKWRVKDSEGENDFYYFTMEHDEREGPILAFVRKSENEWQLFSIWQEFEHKSTIASDVLLKAVDRYLTKLEDTLLRKFNIKYSYFTRF